MTNEERMATSIDDYLEKLTSQDPSIWTAKLLLELEKELRKKGYSGGEILNTGFPLLKTKVSELVDDSIDGLIMYNEEIEADSYPDRWK